MGVESVICRVGEHRIALPIEPVIEVLAMLALTPVPDAPRHCLGTFNYRGAPMLALDLCARLGVESRVEPHTRHLMVVELGGVRMAWAVDRILDQRLLELTPPPPLPTAPMAAKLLRGYGEDAEGRIPLLHPDALLGAGLRALAREWAAA